MKNIEERLSEIENDIKTIKSDIKKLSQGVGRAMQGPAVYGGPQRRPFPMSKDRKKP